MIKTRPTTNMKGSLARRAPMVHFVNRKTGKLLGQDE
jgi:hypothetical protein